MKAIEAVYGRWGNYIPSDIRKQFEKDCLDAEQQIKELKEKTCHADWWKENDELHKQIKELKELLGRSIYSVEVNDRLYSEIKQTLKK